MTITKEALERIANEPCDHGPMSFCPRLEARKAQHDYDRYLQQRGITAEEHEREIGEWLDSQD